MLQKENKIRRCRPMMGTFVTLDVQHPSYKVAQSAVTQAFSVLEEVAREASFFQPGNWLSQLHRTSDFEGCWRLGHLNFKNSPTWGESLLSLAHLLFVESCGLFNPFTHGRLDLSGVAKGFAVDLAMQTLMDFNISQALINAGGDLRVLGPPQTITVLDGDRQARAQVQLYNSALATSHSRPEHWSNLASLGFNNLQESKLICVQAPSCALADGLTKIAGHVEGQALLKNFHAQAIVFDIDCQSQGKVIGW